MSAVGGAPARIRIFVDADACPVKAEIYRVAERYRLAVFVVSNSLIAVPPSTLIERVVVEAGPDVADGWIADRARAGDVVVTSDVPLAARCVRAGAEVLGPTGPAPRHQLDRHDAGHPQPDGGPAVGRPGHRRPAGRSRRRTGRRS